MIKRLRKKYITPSKPWDKERIKIEREILKKYGLKNKKELWKFENKLRSIRGIIRGLIAVENKERGEEIIKKLKSQNIIPENAGIYDVLNLNIEDLLERRLQTLVYKKGYAKSLRHARQLVTHGHITINGRRVCAPSYIVKKEEEDLIELSPKIIQVNVKNE
jgi:small subunit ribosomal protein S4